MDTDAVIRRAPELALIDELAHTNAPGSPHNKRYQDIEAVLDAGIDVISTVNVQHLESLNDTVFELTGVRVRETFPDRILDEADEVVLVDLSPQELQERLRAGKVYPLGRVETALANFFRAEKLGALRQLALRELSEDVEARREARIHRPGRPAGHPRADPRPGHPSAQLAAAAAPRLALGPAPGRRHRRAVGARPGRAPLRGSDRGRSPRCGACPRSWGRTSWRRRAAM